MKNHIEKYKYKVYNIIGINFNNANRKVVNMSDIEKELGSLELDDIENIDLDEIDDFITTGKPQAIIQEALGGVTTFVDIVFCIDVTASMAPIINTVKNLTLDLYDDLIEEMRNSRNRIVTQLRVRVIAFRDYYCDGEYAMQQSDFFTLPNDKAEFRNFVAALEAVGGGDEPENALEAIALAMKSEWVRVNNPNTEKARNVVVVFTDASAHPFEKSKKSSNQYYPADMLKSYNDLYEAWCGQGSYGTFGGEYVMDRNAERLIVFAPVNSYPWDKIAEDIDYAAVIPISAAKGGTEVGRETIINTISGSMR